MLGRPRTGAAQAAVDQALATLAAHFAPGTTPLAPPHMYLAETLLDLYGEDLRARAFLFPDAERGNELCLRPDFTVPVALTHGRGGWDRPAAYAYQGLVFRRQPPGQGRPVEYLQAGVERFGDPDRPAVDAAIFQLLHDGLTAIGVTRVQATIGDLSIPFALLDALDLSDARRAALRRHFWRPGRFQDLLGRAVAPPELDATRQEVLDSRRAALSAMAAAGEAVGRRTRQDVLDRLHSLEAETRDRPLAAADADQVAELLVIRQPADAAPAALRAAGARAGSVFSAAVDQFEQRLDALDACGIPPASLAFDASFGRNLEYYDGFVFEIRAADGQAHPPLAGGGRFDALTARLGAAAPVPAVGGMIRPEAALEART